mmetsp:Transcript_65065/g.121228  ORF Transcript_65065/g.121228 Transcript_65065/m.121228 type:complete len:588 (-) Transcript_65065:223-1986(-)
MAHDILRVGYSSKKVPDEVDHIIIGSGLSGLYLGALLSKLGRRVVVLEQHYVAGGCTHTFKDKGFEFDTGVHYIGQATMLEALMDFGAGKTSSLTMQRSGVKDGSNVYNEIAIGEHTFKFRPGKEAFIQDLLVHFPAEEVALRRFFHEVFAAVMTFGLLGGKHFVPPWVWNALMAVPGPARWMCMRHVQRTTTDVLTACGVQDPLLRSVLCSEFGDYGILPDEAPFCMQAIILFHYIWEGSYYPEHGSDAFALALVPQIVAAGGGVFVRAPVTRIILDGKRAVGVAIDKKGDLYAKRSVISAAGVEVTYRKLLDEATVAKLGGAPKPLQETEKIGSGNHVYCFIGLDGDTEELNLPTHNVWSFPVTAGTTPDISSLWRATAPLGKLPPFLHSDEAASQAEVPCFISFPSAKDPHYAGRCPGKSTAVVLTESRSSYFADAGPSTKRSGEYLKLKARYQNGLLNSFYKHYPHLKGKVSYVDVATPLSNDHYLGRVGSYGLDHSISRFLDTSVQIKVNGINGLYLTGQDLVSCGVFAQPIAAWMTLAKVVGVTSFNFWVLLFRCGWTVAARMLCKPKLHYGALELLRWLQ